MKMKSNLFGYSAKLALAVLAVCGTMFTSCYESDDADKISLPGFGTPEYYVAGTITDANTGSLLSSATVTVDGANVVTDNATFKQKISSYTDAAIKVVVSANGYFTVTKNVYLNEVKNGGVYIAEASAALMPVDAVVLEPSEADPSPTAVKDAVDALPALTAVNVTVDNVSFGTPTSKEENGIVENTLPATFKNNVSSLPADAQYVVYDGFELIGEVQSDPISRADANANEKTVFLNSVTKKLGKKHGFTQRVGTFTIPAWGNYSAAGFKAIYNMVPRTYKVTIDGKSVSGTVVSQEGVMLYPSYYNHDTHNYHDGTGINPNAGGGSASY